MSTPEPPAPPEQPPAGSVERPGPPAPAAPAPRPPAAPVEEEDQPSTFQPWLYLKIGLLLIVIAYAIGFVVKNTRQIKIDFVFGDANVRVIWTILLLLAIGMVSGMLISQLYRHRRRAKLAKQGRKPGDSR
jgi:uncharacterized integral membrane protein